MKKAVPAEILILSTSLFLYCSPASSLVGADLAEGAVQRYTVGVATSRGLCSGVVLAQDIVLTAAHCVEANLQIAGNWGGKLFAYIPVVETVRHPLYNSSDTISPDLAILKLEKPLPDRFIPASLGVRTIGTGDHLIVAGYGTTAAGYTIGGTPLRMGLLRVSGTTKGWLTLVSAGQDAAGGCWGDSGGPVFTYRGMYALVGVIVRGSCGVISGVVTLAPHYGWINETILKLTAPRE